MMKTEATVDYTASGVAVNNNDYKRKQSREGNNKKKGKNKDKILPTQI